MAQVAQPSRPDAHRLRHSRMNNCLTEVMRVCASSLHSGARSTGGLAHVASQTRPDARRLRHSRMNNCLTEVMRVCERSLHSIAQRSGRLAQAASQTRPDARRSRHSRMNNCLTGVMRVLTDLCDLRTRREDLAACAALPKLLRHAARTTLG